MDPHNSSIFVSCILQIGVINYSDKLAHVQVVINCQFSVAQMCTWEDIHARLFTRAVLDDVMSSQHLICILSVNNSILRVECTVNI